MAVVALVVNYEHARDVAARNGEQWRQWLYPLAADGLILAASLVMLVRRLLRLTAGPLAWTAFAAGIAASAAANIAHAVHQGGDVEQLVERITVAAWPTLALLAAHEMLLQLVGHFVAEQMNRANTVPPQHGAPLAAQGSGEPQAAGTRAVVPPTMPDQPPAAGDAAPPMSQPAAATSAAACRPSGLAAARQLKDAARAEARRARDAGEPYRSGKDLGRLFNRGERWGRSQLAAVEAETLSSSAPDDELALISTH